jgi:hypothetical protein
MQACAAANNSERRRGSISVFGTLTLPGDISAGTSGVLRLIEWTWLGASSANGNDRKHERSKAFIVKYWLYRRGTTLDERGRTTSS